MNVFIIINIIIINIVVITVLVKSVYNTPNGIEVFNLELRRL